MSNINELFEMQVKQFEHLLAQYGYQFKVKNYDDSGELFEVFKYIFTTPSSDTSCEIDLNRYKLNNSYSLNFRMLQGHKYFSISEYCLAHKEEGRADFVSKISRENPEQDINNYLVSLEKAFATYLNDQITGKAFEDHSDAVLRSYYDQAYGMQKSIVAEEQKKRDNINSEIAKMNEQKKKKSFFKRLFNALFGRS